MDIWKKVRARLEPRIMGCTPKRFSARLSGKRVIANSIPKGGTHLLTRCLMYFPCLTYSGYHYTDGIAKRSALEKILRKTNKGRFSAAHLWWSEEAAGIFAEAGIRQIVMIRDPRDIVVSGVHFILKRKRHHLHKYFSSLNGMSEMLICYIKGVDKRYSTRGMDLADIRTSFHKYIRWANEENSLVVRFEDLIGPSGGGGSHEQKKAINSIAEHCRIQLRSSQVERIAGNVFSSASVTFRKGSFGSWCSHFTGEVKETFCAVAGDLLIENGYASSMEW